MPPYPPLPLSFLHFFLPSLPSLLSLTLTFTDGVAVNVQVQTNIISAYSGSVARLYLADASALHYAVVLDNLAFDWWSAQGGQDSEVGVYHAVLARNHAFDWLHRCWMCMPFSRATAHTWPMCL
jgi:hypothetical protein